jgi:hypothetical protein
VLASLKAVAAAVADGDFSRAELDALAAAAFVPVANASATEPPARLFARAPPSLAPLRHEIPPGLAEAAPTLRLLGARDAFGPRDAAETLRVAAADAGGRALGPDEVRAAVAALDVAVAAVAKDVSVSATNGGLDVFAPDRRGVLTPPSALFHARGAPARLLARARAAGAGGGAGPRLRLAHPSVSGETCRLAGVAALADAAKERLFRVETETGRDRGGTVSEGETVETVENVSHAPSSPRVGDDDSTASDDPSSAAIRCATTESFAATLATRAFAEALRRATRHAVDARLAGHEAFATVDALAARLARLGTRVTVVPDLHTRLVVTRNGARNGDVRGAVRETETETETETERTFAGAPTRRAAFFCADADRIFVRRVVRVDEANDRNTHGRTQGGFPVKDVPACVLAHVLAPALADALGVESSGADGGAVAVAAAALLSAGALASRATESLGPSLRDVAEAVAPETDPTRTPGRRGGTGKTFGRRRVRRASGRDATTRERLGHRRRRFRRRRLGRYRRVLRARRARLAARRREAPPAAPAAARRGRDGGARRLPTGTRKTPRVARGGGG